MNTDPGTEGVGGRDGCVYLHSPRLIRQPDHGASENDKCWGYPNRMVFPSVPCPTRACRYLCVCSYATLPNGRVRPVACSILKKGPTQKVAD